MIVLSQTYQASSAFEPEAARVDPERTLLWRRRHRRLEAEVVRDSILAVSGQLNPRMGGPGFYPTLRRRARGPVPTGRGWGKSDAREQSRRSIYIFANAAWGSPRSTCSTLPTATSSCEQRIVSTTGPQGAHVPQRGVHPRAGPALRLSVGRRSRGREREPSGPSVCVALGRPPRPEEIAGRRFNSSTSKSSRSSPMPRAANAKTEAGRGETQALEAFCLVVLNSNELVYNITEGATSSTHKTPGVIA